MFHKGVGNTLTSLSAFLTNEFYKYSQKHQNKVTVLQDNVKHSFLEQNELWILFSSGVEFLAGESP